MPTAHGRRKEPGFRPFRPVYLISPKDCAMRGGIMSDLLYIGLTIVVFTALFLLLKGVERFER
jgi:hypothetical protein